MKYLLTFMAILGKVQRDKMRVNFYIKKYSALFALYTLKSIRKVAGFLYSFSHIFSKIISPIGKLFLTYLILPIYTFFFLTKLRIQKLSIPARGFFIFLVSNRYLFHTTLGLMALVTFIAHAQTRQAHAQEVGSHSLLLALTTDQHTEIVEEAVNQENFTKDVHYLNSAAFLYVPNIDFDYDESQDVIYPPTLSVPGTIAANPSDEAHPVSIAKRDKTSTYIVKENNTIGSIAQEFGVNIGTILWNNNLTERQYIRPGDVLRIPPISGIIVKVKKGEVLSTITKSYGGNVDEIITFNKLPSNGVNANMELFIPGGHPPIREQERILVAVRRQSPVPSEKKQPKKIAVADTTALEEPSAPTESTAPSDEVSSPGETYKPDDVSPDKIPSTKLVWPSSSHTITQYYGWRHTGVDIDGDYSSPIYAADDGVVDKAGWNSGGYGLMILIRNDEDGLTTRYGHSSKLFVKEGDVVKKGQVIAMVGTTGRSTGTHLHFEVYANGRRTNPLSYIK